MSSPPGSPGPPTSPSIRSLWWRSGSLDTEHHLNAEVPVGRWRILVRLTEQREQQASLLVVREDDRLGGLADERLIHRQHVVAPGLSPALVDLIDGIVDVWGHAFALPIFHSYSAPGR